MRRLNGGAGNDTLDVGRRHGSSSTRRTVPTNSTAGQAADTLGAGRRAGNPAITGRDDVRGGEGFDTADYSARDMPLTIDLDDPGGDGERGEGDTVQPDVEHLIGGSEGDTLSGSAADNILEGRAGDDTISGRGGSDELSGGSDSGTDDVSGGPGDDVIAGGGGEDDLRGDDDNDVVSGGGGGDDLNGGAGGDTLQGGPGVDKIEGEAGDDTIDGAEPGITGADGGDDLSGGSGMDTLAGGRGNDTMDGGAGPDVMDGDAGRDTVTYVNRSGPVTVTLDGVPNDGEEGEGDNVQRTVEEVVGGSVADTLSGDADSNTINGASGEDDLEGNRGRDELTGGNATDLIRARDGNRDIVACGDDQDIAIVDPKDLVRDCETEDAGGRRRLVVGRTALVSPTRGNFGLQPPEARRFFTLSETLKIPVRSTIDATDGEVRLATAGKRAGRRQTIFASGGMFTVRQRRGGRGDTELRLKGPRSKCPRASGRRQGAIMQDEPKRRLRTRIVKATRQFKVRGKYSVGAAKGTIWWTEERCDGTLTRVESGTVRVQDLVRDKTVTVKAPGSYLARPR